MLLLVLWEFYTMYLAPISPSSSPPRPFHSPHTQCGVFSLFFFLYTFQFVLIKQSCLCGISLEFVQLTRGHTLSNLTPPFPAAIKCQSLLVQGQNFVPNSFFHVQFCLVCACCVCCHNHCDIMCGAVILCPEDILFL